MPEKTSCPKQFGTLTQAVYYELGDPEGLTREEIKQRIKEFHGHASGMEVDEVLAQLMGNTPEHRKCYAWCDASVTPARYRLRQQQGDPYIRACLVFAVFESARLEGANHYRVLDDLTRLRRIPQDLVLGHLRELQDEKLLVDQGIGKIVLNPETPRNVYDAILVTLPNPQGAQKP